MLQIGSTLAGYRIERVIGTGHVGTVYLARSPDLPRYDALKVADRDMMDDAALRDRFVREADVGARLNHPNIVAIHRRGTDDGLLWIAMQYVEGIDASAALQQGRISAERAVYIISEIARAIDHAHSHQVIHRDIKPANFLLSNDGRVLLGDFGTAHIIGDPEPATESVVATLPYAAPEVLSGNPVDVRADIYSLGCSLFRLLTGRTPFSGDGDTAAVIARHLHDPPPRVSDSVSGLSPAMDAVIARALAKDPRERFENAEALALAAAAALQLPSTTAPVGEVDHSPTSRPHFEPPPSPRPRPVEDGRPSPPEPSPGPAAAASMIARSRITDLIAGLASRWQSHERGRIIRLAGAAVAVVAIVVTSLVWLMSRPGNDSAGGGAPTPDTTTRMVPAQESSSPSTALRNPGAEARLMRALPPGYPPESCKPVAPSDGVQAALRCSVTLGPGAGAASVTHELLPSSGALQTAFTSILDDSTVFICPGNIASPGAWRRNATPEVVSGTVACGRHQGRPIVAWTTDDALLVSAVQAATPDVTADELFAWWSLHS